MNSHSLPRCPECGKPVPAESQHQVCPACLLAQALASGTAFDPAAASSSSSAKPQPPPPAPEEIAGKFPQFEILSCLGRGGMGVVYKARQKSLNRLVAIKILAPGREHDARFAERFAREAELLAKLSHPHIVTIHDFGETGGLFYIVMEFVDGVNLRDLLREGKIEPRQALAIVPPVCEALQYAHDHGVVHRDIKPENLLLDREGRVKIADFGIAALVGGDGAGGTGERAGTPPYMAPEQGGAKPAADHRADIYALGVVLYEMLTGERPGREVVAPSRKVQIDVRLDEIVLRALEKQPELRYATATEFKTQVETVAAEGARTGARGGGAAGATRFSPTALFGAVAGITFSFTGLPFVLGWVNGTRWPGILILLLGMCVMTLCGWVAASQIRRSAGGLHGLWLAVFDGLLFPLLALNLVVVLPIVRFARGLEHLTLGVIGLWAVALGCLIAGNVLFIHWVWRRVVGGETRDSRLGTSEKERVGGIAAKASVGRRKWALGLGIGGGLLAGLTLAIAVRVAAGAHKFPWHKIPEGYEDFVVLVYGQPGFPELPENGRHQILRYPADGILITSSSPSFGLNADQIIETYDEGSGAVAKKVAAWSRHESGGTRTAADGLRFSYLVKAVGSPEYWKARNVAAYRAKIDEAERKLRAQGRRPGSAPSSSALPAGDPAQASFAPVVERDLPFASDGFTGWLDLDSGKYPHEDFPSASINFSKNGTLSATAHLVIESVPREQWDTLTAEQVIRVVGNAPFPGFTGDTGRGDGLPKVWLFKTIQGGMGIMQITALAENSRGVRIRYKLVRQEKKAASSATEIVGGTGSSSVAIPGNGARIEQAIEAAGGDEGEAVRPETVSFGGVEWQAWRTLFEVREGSGAGLVSLPKVRPGYDYGHWGRGRGPEVVTNIGNPEWRDYRVEADLLVPGVDPALNPHGLGLDFHGAMIAFHVVDKKESWNEAGTSAYVLGFEGPGNWSLTAHYNSYCRQPKGWGNSQSDGDRRLAGGSNVSLDPVEGNRFRIDVLGTRIQVWIDERKIVDVVDEQMGEPIGGRTLDHGGVAFVGGFDAMIRLRSFRITKL